MKMVVNNHELIDFKVEMYVGYEIYLWQIHTGV
jgi:hypothetical protein